MWLRSWTFSARGGEVIGSPLGRKKSAIPKQSLQRQFLSSFQHPSLKGASASRCRPISRRTLTRSMITLPGLMSRCSTPRSCAYSRALQTSVNRRRSLRNSSDRLPGSRCVAPSAWNRSIASLRLSPHLHRNSRWSKAKMLQSQKMILAGVFRRNRQHFRAVRTKFCASAYKVYYANAVDQGGQPQGGDRAVPR